MFTIQVKIQKRAAGRQIGTFIVTQSAMHDRREEDAKKTRHSRHAIQFTQLATAFVHRRIRRIRPSVRLYGSIIQFNNIIQAWRAARNSTHKHIHNSRKNNSIAHTHGSQLIKFNFVRFERRPRRADVAAFAFFGDAPTPAPADDDDVVTVDVSSLATASSSSSSPMLCSRR